jgi:hypothetical protein
LRASKDGYPQCDLASLAGLAETAIARLRLANKAVG